jgi:PPOX class probable F420-dependent enzyme
MPYHKMTPVEVQGFLRSRPARPGVLATVRAGGRPHAAPVWYDVDKDGTVVFSTGETSVKGRNLRREGWAAICVEDPQPPYSFVLVEGPVTLITELDQLRAWNGRLGARYMGEERTKEFADRNGVPGQLLVRLTPEKVTATADLADG